MGGIPEEDRGFSFVVEFLYSFELYPRVLLEPALEVRLHTLHLLSDVDLPLNSEQKQLDDPFPFWVYLASLHLLGFYPISQQEGRVDDRIGNPFKAGLESIILRDRILTFAYGRQQESIAQSFQGSRVVLPPHIDIRQCDMEGRFFDIKPAELGYDLREGSD